MTDSATANRSLPPDYEIAQRIDKSPIWEVAAQLGLEREDLDLYGQYKAKLTRDALKRLMESADSDSNLVLVTGMTPTPLGEGKTVTTVGLGQALTRRGHTAIPCIREPSLGPVFGLKGGAAGGGYAQVVPMEDINLHFTGDIHALTAAHNLIASMVDNHIANGNGLDIDINRVEWKRSIDMNDRVLREIVVGLGGKSGGIPREDGFTLTAASELMAVLCLSTDLADLKDRIARIIVAYDREGAPVTVEDIGAVGATTILLRDAIRPNLVQTVEQTPAMIHGGPFANIAHGTNSIIADIVAGSLAEYVITEAGFGSDLGAEKFLNVVCRYGDFTPDVAVLVVTARALKYHGHDMWPVDHETLKQPDVDAVRSGFANLDHHVKNLRQYGLPVVVAINRFGHDVDAEIECIRQHCSNELDVYVRESTVFAEGGAGGAALADAVVEAIEDNDQTFSPLYALEDPIEDKIETIAQEMYGADSVSFVAQARDDIEQLRELGLADVPVVISKTFHSLSDDPTQKGAPTDWELEIQRLYPAAGAGFVVALTGDVLTLPGLPAEPAAAKMDIDAEGRITGLF